MFPFIIPKKCNYDVYDIIVTSLWYVATWQHNFQGVHTKLGMHLIHVCVASVIGPRADGSHVNKLKTNWIITPSPSAFGKVRVAIILCAFAKLRKTTISSSCMSVRPSVCPHGTRLLPNGLSWNLIFEYFSKICPKIQVSLISDKNNGCFTLRPTYIVISSHWILLRIRTRQTL
jgi:hypothetical protein